MKKDYTKIDGVNWVLRNIPTKDGIVEMQGLSVRALRASLANCDPDALVFYMGEMRPETCDVYLLGGVITNTIQSDAGAVFIVGPETFTALKNAGEI